MSTHQKNPLLGPFHTPFGIPPFAQGENKAAGITLEHFMPAVAAGIAAQQAEVQAIIENAADPSFENTVLALELSGRLLNRVNLIFSNLNSAHTNDAMQKLAKELAPKLSAHYDSINMNASLFARIQKVWQQRMALHLAPDALQLLEQQYKQFVRNGALLDDKQKEALRAINSKYSVCALQFGENMLKETNDYTLYIEDEQRLKGMPPWLLQQAETDARERGYPAGWAFTLHNPSVMPVLQYADDRSLREEIWRAYAARANRGNPADNNALIAEMVALRIERARLLGYPSHAAYVLEENMARHAEGVQAFLQELWPVALKAARAEADTLKQHMALLGLSAPLQPWDWRYLENKVMGATHHMDTEVLKPYFSVPAVREGIFGVARKLYALHFKPIDNAPTYHPDCMAFEVCTAQGAHVGVLLLDLYARPSKRGGAWMTSYQKQEGEGGQRVAPIIGLVCNFPSPQPHSPSLLSTDEVCTFFHEFGHALHGLLSEVRFRSLSGTAVPRDFVELPSQLMEHWAMQPEVLRSYARHYRSAEVLPEALIDQLQRSGTYGQGFATVEYMASAWLDLAYHARSTPLEAHPAAFEAQLMKAIGLPAEIVPRHRSQCFAHIFSGGYSAAYYSYLWSAVLDADAFEAWEDTGDIFDQEVASRFRKWVLSSGHTAHPDELYKAFRGRSPRVQALLKKRGFISTQAPAS